MTKTNFSIVITGEWPGAGQSTTAILLAKKLKFERVYAGFLFRKFAYIWNQEKSNYAWPKFEKAFIDHQIKLDDYPFTEADFNESILHQWQHQLKKVNTPDLWDKIIDEQSLLSLNQPGVVVEAKVGVLLDKTNLAKNFSPKHTIHKILLTCPPEISAHRVIKRKIDNGELEPMVQDSPEYLELVRQTATETINRHLRDWERYEKIYSIFRSDIYSEDVHQVSTANTPPEKVVATILDILKT